MKKAVFAFKISVFPSSFTRKQHSNDNCLELAYYHDNQLNMTISYCVTLIPFVLQNTLRVALVWIFLHFKIHTIFPLKNICFPLSRSYLHPCSDHDAIQLAHLWYQKNCSTQRCREWSKCCWPETCTQEMTNDAIKQQLDINYMVMHKIFSFLPSFLKENYMSNEYLCHVTLLKYFTGGRMLWSLLTSFFPLSPSLKSLALQFYINTVWTKTTLPYFS